MKIELTGTMENEYGQQLAAKLIIDTDKGLLIVRESWDRAVYRLVPVERETDAP